MTFKRFSSRTLLLCVIGFLFFFSFFANEVRAGSGLCIMEAVYVGEPSLSEILITLGFTNVNEISIETFPAGTYNITLYSEFSIYSNENELSHYQVGTSLFHTIFTGPEGGSGYVIPPISKNFTANDQFGLSMLASHGTDGTYRYFTETWRNPDGKKHAKVFENLDEPGTFIIGFENSFGECCCRRDYNDMVFSLRPVPCTFNLTITSTAGGSTDPVTGEYTHFCGTIVEVSAVADVCYVFDHWELDGVPVGSANPFPVLMDDDHALHAVFVVVSYELTVSAGVGGTTSPVPGVYGYDCGSYAVVSAVADVCYVFDHWELDGVPVGSDNPISVLMDTDHILHAVFTRINYTLTITSSTGGTTNPVPGTYVYPCCTNVTVSAVADVCYVFDHWELDGVPVGSDNPIFIHMGADHTLNAIFTPTNYTLTITKTNGGSTDPVPGVYGYDCGSYAVVSAVADVCYVFDHWELDGVPVGSDNPISVLMNDDHTLHAVFLSSAPPLSVSIDPLSASILLGDSVSFTSSVSGGISPFSYQWCLDGSPVLGANSASWTFTPTSVGTYYVYLEVTDECNSTTQSSTARISVTPIPVGGYSSPINRQTEKSPMIYYSMILGLFGVAISLLKRKRK